MKSSPEPIRAWTPPELGDDVPKPRSEPVNKREQALAIFQKEASTVKPVVHTSRDGEKFSAWQPAALDSNLAHFAVDAAAWTFLDVRKALSPIPPKSAKRDLSPIISQREILRSESEVTSVLEQARRQADEIILAAQREADEALLQVESEIEAQKNLARQQGRDEARAELGQALEAARKMVAEVEAWQAELAAQGETILVEMLKDIARKMFGEGVKLDPETLHAHLTQVMDNARGLGVLKIFLNPNDARLLDPAWGEQQMLSLGEQVKIVPSGNILRGGCLVKGNVGTVDARVETQLEAILKSLAEAGE